MVWLYNKKAHQNLHLGMLQKLTQRKNFCKNIYLLQHARVDIQAESET